MSYRLTPLPCLQAQDVEFDEAAVKDQVVDTFKHIKVVEWLKVCGNLRAQAACTWRKLEAISGG